jgi:hypothetical protein
MPPTTRFAEAFLAQEDLEHLRHGHTTERIDHISQTTLLKQIPQTFKAPQKQVYKSMSSARCRRIDSSRRLQIFFEQQKSS